MKKIIFIAGGIILVAVVGVGVWMYLPIKTDEAGAVENVTVSAKTAVVCGSIPGSSCYRYTCTYGIISLNIGGGADCIGGPKPTRGEEVAR